MGRVRSPHSCFCISSGSLINLVQHLKDHRSEARTAFKYSLFNIFYRNYSTDDIRVCALDAGNYNLECEGNSISSSDV